MSIETLPAVTTPLAMQQKISELCGHTADAQNPHSVTAEQVAMTGYVRPAEASAVASADTAAEAIGKLEAALGAKAESGDIPAVANDLTTTQAGYVLDARQGKLLAERILAAGAGDMTAAVYDGDGDGKVNAAQTADAIAGVTATAQELSLMSGVTSNVQTQLDGKQPAGAYLTAETDPTVPSWAKAAAKPAYTPSEVGALPAPTQATVLPTGALADNTEYRIAAAIDSYTAVFPTGSWSCWIKVATSASFTAWTWPAGVTALGADMAASHTYEISIKDGVPIVAEVA